MDEFLAPRDRVLAAEAKLVASLAVLVWLLPLIFVVELILAANGLVVDASFGGPVASVLKTLIWVLFLMFLGRLIERQLNEARRVRLKALQNPREGG